MNRMPEHEPRMPDLDTLQEPELPDMEKQILVGRRRQCLARDDGFGGHVGRPASGAQGVPPGVHVQDFGSGGARPRLRG